MYKETLYWKIETALQHEKNWKQVFEQGLVV